MRLALLALAALPLAAFAADVSADAPWQDRPDFSAGQWAGFATESLSSDGVKLTVAIPATPAPGRPWVLAVGGMGYHGEVEKELLARGYHVANAEAFMLYGAKPALDAMDRLYTEARARYKLAPRCVLRGVSRAGLALYRYAGLHPERVACIFAEGPVMDFRTWPGTRPEFAGEWRDIKRHYGFKSDAEALAFREQPLDRLPILAKAKIPILHIVGPEDRIVPADTNTHEAARRFKKMGYAGMQVIVHEGPTSMQGHACPLTELPRVIEFITQHTAP